MEIDFAFLTLQLSPRFIFLYQMANSKISGLTARAVYFLHSPSSHQLASEESSSWQAAGMRTWPSSVRAWQAGWRGPVSVHSRCLCRECPTACPPPTHRAGFPPTLLIVPELSPSPPPAPRLGELGLSAVFPWPPHSYMSPKGPLV